MRIIPEKLCDYKFSFVPVAKKGKNPIIDEWQLTNYKYDDPKIQQHLKIGGNIGILCKEGCPTIIDFDDEEIEKEISPKLPKTFTIKSGRGRMHKYYFCKNSENKAIEGCDILANKKQAIIPPSIHPNGNEYTVIDNSPIATIDFDEIKAHFFKYWKQKEMPNTTQYSNNSARIIKNTVSITEYLRDCGIDTSLNPTMCPLGHDSIGKKCFSFDDLKQVGYCFHRTCEKGGDVIRLVELKERISFKEALKWLSDKYNITLPQSQFVEKQETQTSEGDGEEFKPDIKKMVWDTTQQLLSENNFISYGEKERSTIFVYENGIFVSCGKQRIHKTLSDQLEKNATVHVKNEVINHIYSLTVVDELPEAPVELLCVENGVLNVLTREFKPHTSDIVFFQKIPVNYEPTKVCANIEKFLKEILKPEDIMTIKKWTGYCLLKDYRYHNLLMLNGSGANGKSTLLSLLKKFLGERNVCSIPMQQLETDKFALVLLKNKMANIFADLPSSALHTTSKLKGLTGEDNFSADQKFKDHIGFQSYAKQMFSCNQLPLLPEDNEAIWRRFILIDLPHCFDITRRDVTLLSKLSSPDEMSGFLNYALEGLKQLIIDNGFERAIETTREAYMRRTDSLATFVLDCLYKKPDSFITKEEFYSFYGDYCRTQGYDMEVESVFFRHLKTKIACHYGQTTKDGRRVTAVFGIDYKTCMGCKSNFQLHSEDIVLFPHKFISYTTAMSNNPLHPLQLQLENIIDRRKLENLLNIINHLKDTLQHLPTFEEIQTYTSIAIETLKKMLEQLKKEGHIYEPQPDCYEVLN